MSVCRIRFWDIQRQRMAWPWKWGHWKGHWKWRRSIDYIRLSFGPYLIPFLSYLTLSDIVTLKSGLEIRVIQTGTIRKLGCGFLFAFHSNYDSILHHLRYKARYLSKIVIISNPLVFGDPVQGVPVGISPSRLVWKKTRMVGLTDGEKILRICITVYTQYRRVTDGQTDRHLATA